MSERGDGSVRLVMERQVTPILARVRVVVAVLRRARPDAAAEVVPIASEVLVEARDLRGGRVARVIAEVLG